MRGEIWRLEDRRKIGVTYRRGGRCRLEERRKTSAITGGEEDGNHMQDGRKVETTGEEYDGD